MLKLFPAPFIYHDKVINHINIKNEILPHILNEYNNNKNDESYVWQSYGPINNNANTNFYNSLPLENTLQKYLIDIVFNPTNKLIDELYNLDEFARPSSTKPISAKLASIWWNVYGNGKYVEPHNHGLFGISGVYFLDLPNDEPNSTTFLFNNHYPISDDKTEDFSLLYHNTSYVKEGDVLLFPTAMPHYVNPVNSTKVSIAFNVKLTF
jgi:hypothetical protein